MLLAGIQFMTDRGCYPWNANGLTRREIAIPSLIEAQLGAPKGSFDLLMTKKKKENVKNAS